MMLGDINVVCCDEHINTLFGENADYSKAKNVTLHILTTAL